MAKREKKPKKIALDQSYQKGNYIYSDGQIYELTTVYKNQAFGVPLNAKKGIWIKSENIKPIPLFKNLLLRVGAVDPDLRMSGYKWLEHSSPNSSNVIRTSIPNKESEKWGLTLVGMVPTTLIIRWAQYLHEYQNFCREVAQINIKLCGNTKS